MGIFEKSLNLIPTNVAHKNHASVSKKLMEVLYQEPEEVLQLGRVQPEALAGPSTQATRRSSAD